MADVVGLEFKRFISAERLAKRVARIRAPLAPGAVTRPVRVASKSAALLVRAAARRAAGLHRPSKRTEVVWVDGDSELAVGLDVDVAFDEGVVRLALPVRCDQTGPVRVEVTFAVGTAASPAGLYGATPSRPTGPGAVVDQWGEALIAFAWQCLLGLATGLAGALGKDARGNLLVPAEIAASPRGLLVQPMARHHFAGSSGLLPTKATR